MPAPPSEPFGRQVESAAETIVGESVDAGFLGEGAEIRASAVSAGNEGKRSRGKPFGLGAKLAMGWMAFVVVMAILAKAGILTWGDAQESVARCARKGPFADEGGASGYLLGCDSNGRNMAARLALGAWTSMLVATGAIALGFLVGGTLGLTAGYFSGKVDTFLTGMFNVLLSVPSVIMALALVAFLQGSPSEAATSGLPAEMILIIAIGVVSVPLVGRITRASALSWAQREFVLAARAQGAKNGRVMAREVLPNVLPAMFSISLLGIAVAIVAEGTLSILGVGVRPPTPSWGNIIALDRGNLFKSPHIVFEASILIFLTVLSLNYLGDVIRARFDVREGAL
ncbi:MAG TPA: ABC transporter permease [Acidimicrobiia bacterium]|nr:ABC transporter permease [Acidimicrobiia bacterium]